MTTEDKLNANDKLNIIYNKISFISRMVMYMNDESYTFNSYDIWGFGIILGELQDEIKEVKDLVR